MSKLTNKAIISDLMPRLKSLIAEFQAGRIMLDAKSYSGKPYYERIEFDGVGKLNRYRITDYGDMHILQVSAELDGRFDHATVIAHVFPDGIRGYGYEKEYRGMGNGYYADLDATGKIKTAEWD